MSGSGATHVVEAIALAVGSMGISVEEIVKVEGFGSAAEVMSTIGKATVAVDAADAKFKMMGDTMDGGEDC